MDSAGSLESGLLKGRRLPRLRVEEVSVDSRLIELYDKILTKCWQYECASRPDWSSIFHSLQRMQVGTGVAAKLNVSGAATVKLNVSTETTQSGVSSLVQPHEQRRECNLLEIPWCELSFSPETDFIDEGAFGAFYKGMWRGNMVVAIKKLLMKSFGKRVVQEMQQEAKLLCQLDHENVVQLHGVCFESPNYALIMQYAAPSLATLLGDVEAFPVGDQYLAARQIACGMMAIHAAGILHHDLRTCNVLVGEDRRCRIADFGLSRTKLQSSKFSKKTTGNPAWSAPEYLEGNAPFTTACDVFSYAMVLFEISSDPPGAAPFRGSIR